MADGDKQYKRVRGFKWTMGDEDVPALALVVDDTSKILHICEPADVITDWGLAACSHPTVCVHSATNPATEYIKMYHDATNAYIDGVGATAIKILVAGTAEVDITSSTVAPSASDGAALGTISLMWSDLFLASGGVVNFNNGNVTITHSANALAFAGAASSATNGYSFDVASGTLAGEHHGVDITVAGACNTSDDSLVGLNVAVTPTGTLGTWSAGIFAKVTQTVESIDGYVCGAEFEVNKSGAITNRNYGVIVLNNGNNIAGSQSSSAFILCREYGSNVLNALVKFGDNASYSASASSAVAVSAAADGAATHKVRFITTIAGVATPMWFLATTTAPA